MPGRAEDVAKYYAMCEWFDETCGQLLGYLDQKNLTENTMVIYICDNGWAAASTNASDSNQKIWKGFALRSKGSPYESGIRTPIMVSWPGHMKPGHLPDLAHAIDIFPTIAAAAGLKAPENLQGINLLNAEARANRKAVFGVTNSIHKGNPDDTLVHWELEALRMTSQGTKRCWDSRQYCTTLVSGWSESGETTGNWHPVKKTDLNNSRTNPLFVGDIRAAKTRRRHHTTALAAGLATPYWRTGNEAKG